MLSFLGFQASFAIGDQIDEAQMVIIVIGVSYEVRVKKNIIQTPGVGALVMCYLDPVSKWPSPSKYNFQNVFADIKIKEFLEPK